MPELTYSPWATEAYSDQTGTKAKAWRIDLVMFVNGLPVATLELKSEFKQAVQNAIKQYKTTRLPIDPATRKPEPLLTFKRGALVHFAVSQYEVFMTTRLEGAATFFLPFNKGTRDGGAGNDVPDDVNQYATDYLWNEVLLPDNLLKILARYAHLQIEEKEDWEGRKYRKETLIFPRYHQWDVVNKLITAAHTEGPGHKYLVQHSAGSGKSKSIAWTAHQLSSLYDQTGNKQFDSVIIVTDRNVLDAQLQDTIYQFEHVDGVVGRINNKEGDGSKSEKLAAALENSRPIIIVTIQTFPFVLKAIEDDVSLKERHYAVIADEAQADDEAELTTDDILDVLKNYTNYKVAYQLALKIQASDQEVESKRARVKLNQWVRLHDYNIAQKVQVIVEHFKDKIKGMLGGQAKAMVVTSSRKEAVRYKLGFDKYITEKGYDKIHAMVAFSGEVAFNQNDPNVIGLLGEKFTETNMNPNLKNRDMRNAFDSDDYQVMIVANKFQTGFDQPKLCAMYVDKKLGGVECVQTLSRLNRTYPGKAESSTYILDFFNDPKDILESFQPYYQTAGLADVSDPDLIFDLFDKLRGADIFRWHEVEQFCEAFLQKSKSSAAIGNICKPAVEGWKLRYKSAVEAYRHSKKMFERTKKMRIRFLLPMRKIALRSVKKKMPWKSLKRTWVPMFVFMSLCLRSLIMIIRNWKN